MLIKDYLENMGYNVVNDDFYDKMDLWLSWYSGKVDSFHSYTQYNGKRNLTRSRATLGMGKKVCEDWANLLLNEKVNMFAVQEHMNGFIQNVLDENDFRVRANRLIELTYALGTGAFVEYIENKTVKIDYIRANMIFPLSWDNGKITQCAFAGEKIINNTPHTYLNMHILKDGKYTVINKLFIQNGDGLEETYLPEGVAEEYNTNSSQPLFQIIMPNIANNLDLDNPMGISVFANAIDILQGIDLVYDSYQNEFRLGKKRILVPAGMAQMQSSQTGVTPIFDDNDTEFYAMTDKSLTDLREINMALRAEPHEMALQKNLNLLSVKCGFGNGKYQYDSAGLKTATEVISEKSDLYQNIRKNEIVLEKALADLARAVCFLGGFDEKPEIKIHFDDSIIEDSGAVAKRALEEFDRGIIGKEEYLEAVYGIPSQKNG